MNGGIVEVVSNNKSSRLGIRIGGRLELFATQHGLGYVTGADGGYKVGDERFIPDAAFISKERQSMPNEDAYNPLAPDLAVEVISPSDDRDELRLKIASYLAAGTVVWVVDADKTQIEVYRPGQPPLVLRANDVLDGGSVLPGFQLAVNDIFAS
jgi:Uma2 family endonuclease